MMIVMLVNFLRFFFFFSLLNNSELSTLKVSTHYSVGDMSLPLQHFAATNDSMCTGRKISYCSKLRGTLQQQIGSCVLDNFCKNLCQFSVMETKIIIAKLFQYRRGDFSPAFVLFCFVFCITNVFILL